MQLKDLVPGEVIEIKDIEEIYKAQQGQFDEADFDIKDLLNQVVSVNTSTWGISFWEKFFRIRSDSSKSLEERKARVTAKLRGQGTSTVQAIKDICNSYVDSTEVIEHNEEYWFNLILKSYSGFPYKLDSLYETIEELKPAHLGVNYELTAITQSNIYMGFIGFDGEVVNTYPWTPNDMEGKLEYYVPVFQEASLENINTYPKEAI